MAPPLEMNATIVDPLTEREAQVVALLAQGIYTDRAIAEELGISERVAHWHVGHVLEKFGANKRMQVLAYVLTHGSVIDGAWRPEATEPK